MGPMVVVVVVVEVVVVVASGRFVGENPRSSSRSRRGDFHVMLSKKSRLPLLLLVLRAIAAAVGVVSTRGGVDFSGEMPVAAGTVGVFSTALHGESMAGVRVAGVRVTGVTFALDVVGLSGLGPVPMVAVAANSTGESSRASKKPFCAASRCACVFCQGVVGEGCAVDVDAASGWGTGGAAEDRGRTRTVSSSSDSVSVGGASSSGASAAVFSAPKASLGRVDSETGAVGSGICGAGFVGNSAVTGEGKSRLNIALELYTELLLQDILSLSFWPFGRVLRVLEEVGDNISSCTLFIPQLFLARLLA